MKISRIRIKLFIFCTGLFFAQFDFRGNLYAISEPGEKFSYSGDILFQGFYLERDISLKKNEKKAECSNYYNENNTTPSPCSEEEDFYRMRFRLNLSFTPSSYAEILYGMEVGFLEFGRDKSEKSGPGSGGRGSGRTNLETREVILRLKNRPASRFLDLGIFSFGTPEGIVVASSGAGLKYVEDFETASSRIELVYVRSVDNSRIDNDSNGFSDSNYSDINLGSASWAFSILHTLRAKLYGVYRNDKDASIEDPLNSKTEEISKLYWGGLYLQLDKGRWSLLLHFIGNGGNFHRPHELNEKEKKYTKLFPELNTIYSNYQANIESGATREVWRRYPVSAGAAHSEITYRLKDDYFIAATAAGGTGRMGVEPDGSRSDYRKDQFRTAGGSFQFSDIGLDTSGGYSAIPDGNLTGVIAKGLEFRGRFLGNLKMQIGYYSFHTYRTPVIDYNINYLQYRQIDRPSNYLGEEWNMKFDWLLSYSDIKLQMCLAYFNAGAGYKIINDVEYGDSIYEASLTIQQKF